jgi:hypothetical protein
MTWAEHEALRRFFKRQRERVVDRLSRSEARVTKARVEAAEAEWELRQVVRGGGKKPSLDYYDRRGW